MARNTTKGLCIGVTFVDNQHQKLNALQIFFITVSFVRVSSCDFVDRLLQAEKSDPRASHEPTRMGSPG